ncbi:hypothetical protein MPSI1_000602 [Malassezia psittaci]|uniref:protein-tyrosine-phosphatase n=1 Tax=Malassezia psittaci TaxID=1821823 RepID=A0AAF0F7S5_9BASI|nr:hypothetical protein MPSI1_000602 [Malassezia psittaci]
MCTDDKHRTSVSQSENFGGIGITAEQLVDRIECAEHVPRRHAASPGSYAYKQSHAIQRSSSWSSCSPPTYNATATTYNDVHHRQFDIHDEAPLLLLDTRPPQTLTETRLVEFYRNGENVRVGRIRGSISLQLPTLLLRRARRMLSERGQSLPNDFCLTRYIHSKTEISRFEELCKRRKAQLGEHIVNHPHFQALFDTYWFFDIVVIFEECGHLSAVDTPKRGCCNPPGRLLLQLIYALQESRAKLAADDPALQESRGGIFYVCGELRGLEQVEEHPSLISNRDTLRSSCAVTDCRDSSTFCLPPQSPCSRTPAGEEMCQKPAAPRSNLNCSSGSSGVSQTGAGPLSTSGEVQPMTSDQFKNSSLTSEPTERNQRKPLLSQLNIRMSEPNALSETSLQEIQAAAKPRHSLRPLDLSSVHSTAAPLSARRGSLQHAFYRDTTLGPDWHEFNVSTVIPGFLYFGSNIVQRAHIEQLRALGIQSVLNTTVEIEDGGLTEAELRLNFPRYLRLPLRDIVEQSNVQQSLTTACDFLDRAWLLSSPTYVHCRAGKSRSAMVVMAYLIRARRWTLQQAYAHVSAHRNQISPNIGFLAELMHFERDVFQSSTHESTGVSQSSSMFLSDARTRTLNLPPEHASTRVSRELRRRASLSSELHSKNTSPVLQSSSFNTAKISSDTNSDQKDKE